MNICVLIKQVPDVEAISIDPVSHTLIRNGVPSIINPYDRYALEAALCIKDKCDARVTTISMGPEQAKEILRESLSVGADEAFLLCDKVFAGSDTLATSYVLSCGIRYIEEKLGIKFDIVMCGKQAADGETAQVGPQIAERLSLPLITSAIDVDFDDEKILLTKAAGNEIWLLEAVGPNLITVLKTRKTPRYPTLKTKLTASKKRIEILSASDIGADSSLCGLKGSPTSVTGTYTYDNSRKCKKVFEEQLDDEQFYKLAGDFLK